MTLQLPHPPLYLHRRETRLLHAVAREQRRLRHRRHIVDNGVLRNGIWIATKTR